MIEKLKFEKEITKKVSIGYLLFLPEDYNKDELKRLPLILFLHGVGESGNDLELVRKHGPPKIAEERKQFPFIVIAPQCPQDEDWSPDILNALLDEVIEKYRADTNRIYLTGLSMGGYGVWNLAVEYPDRFAAIAPICGGGNPQKAGRIKHIPVWVFHGVKDNCVPIEESERMVNSLIKYQGKVKFTKYPEGGHDIWTEVYNGTEIYEWFLKHKKRFN